MDANSPRYDCYQYEDDFQPKGQIRLLKLLYVSAQDDNLYSICCKLAPWYLEHEFDLPKFNAISYTWGDTTARAPVLIKYQAADQVLMVSQNCEVALKQAWLYDKNAWYWIDSICIDQCNPEEKKYQIPLMRQIYGKAQQVLACIGQHADGSQELFEFVFRSHRDASTVLPQQAGHVVYTSQYSWTSSSYPPDSPETIVSAFRRLGTLLSRSYFTRVWVFQELYLAQRVIFACGPDFISARDLLDLSWFISSEWEDWSATQHLCCLPTTRELLEVAASPGTDLMSLKQALIYVHESDLQCQDVVDKIFGILGAVDWKDKEPIIPDYRTTDRFSVAATVLNKISELEGQGLSRWDALTMAHVIGELLGLFDECSLLWLKQEINRRTLRPPEIDRRMWADLIRGRPDARPRNDNEILLYAGYRLQHADSIWRLEGWETKSIQICSDLPPDILARARENNRIMLPKAARVGDWCLFTRGTEGPMLQGLVLIVRPTPVFASPILYDVVGTGFHQTLGRYPELRARSKGLWSPFEIILSAEDMLFLLSAALAFGQTLGWDSSVADPATAANDAALIQMSAMLSAGLCWKQGSSFAIKGAYRSHPDLLARALYFR